MRNFAKTIITIVGIGIGPSIIWIIYELIRVSTQYDLHKVFLPSVNLIIYIVSGIISGIIFLLCSNAIIDAFSRRMRKVEKSLSKTPSHVIFFGTLGFIAGLLVAYLLTGLINRISIDFIAFLLNLVSYVFWPILGMRIFSKKAPEMRRSRRFHRSSKKSSMGAEDLSFVLEEEDFDEPRGYEGCPKILDTSVIIDGRIFDICKTGIMEGKLIVPQFVLDELRHIADSADGLKRNRGRRGLDILSKMQQELDIPVEVVEPGYDENIEVDSKLLILAKDMGGKVITNDFNLNKVAAVQGVKVFNINELANAVKPIVLHGEEMTITISKQGKENNQGLAYLDDGTMIVVEEAKNKVGQQLNVVVTSILQTAAGRMIFAKIKSDAN